MRNEYPYNRMQEKKLKRFERPFYIAMGFAFALAGAMTFTPHTYAKSIELVNTMHDSVETVNDKILSVSPSLTDETVSFWFKTERTTTGAELHNQGGSTYLYLRTDATASPYTGLAMIWNHGAGTFNGVIGKYTGMADSISIAYYPLCGSTQTTTPWLFPDDVDGLANSIAKPSHWYHLAMTLNHSTGDVYLYVDGVQESHFVENGANGMTSCGSAKHLYVGGLNEGQADSVYFTNYAIYNVAQSGTDINTYMCTIPSFSGLQALYTGDTSATYDESGGGHNFTATGTGVLVSNDMPACLGGGGGGGPTGTLQLSRVGGTGSVLTGVPVTFSGSLSVPYGFNHAYFWTSNAAYPNATDPSNGKPLVTQLVGSGAISEPLVFTYTFTTAGAYSPILLYTDCTLDAYTTAASGCHSLLASINPSNADATTLTVTSQAANNLVNKFSTPLATVKVGDKVHFSYSLDNNLCKYGTLNGDHGTVSGVYFFSGEDLNVMSGSGTTAHSNFSYTYVQAGRDSLGVAQPYLSIVCSADTAAWTSYKQPSLNVYLGGSIYVANAQSLNVSALGATDVPVLQNGDYANGGQSDGFGTGTGHNFLFASDVFTAAQGQTINLHIKYFVPYTVNSVILHTDVTNDVNNPPVIGTGSSKGKDLYVPIRYGEAGIMRPWVEVRSSAFNPSDSSTYDIFYLGGTTNISLAKNITITNQVVTTATNFLDSDGIFGLNASAFTVSFGNSQNIFIQWANALATIMVQAALSVAGVGWHIIRISPIFSFIDQSFHPVSGSVHTLPPKIFDQPIAFAPSDATFTIAYASETDSSMIKWFIHIFITVEIMWFVLGSLFPIKQDVRRH